MSEPTKPNQPPPEENALSDQTANADSSAGMGPWAKIQETEGRFSGISRQRWDELIRHYAEIQKYQKDHGLDDRGDPPD